MELRKNHRIRAVGYQLRHIKLFFQGFYYRGNTYYCPLCNRFYRKFLDGGQDFDVLVRLKVIGAGRRKNMLCPGCQSTDRDRLMHTFLCNYPDLSFPNQKMLHIAPEPALYQWIKKQYKSKPENYITGVKYHEGFYYDRNIRLLDITKLPFEDETFGLVMVNHVLEHIAEEAKALAEIHRILQPGGKAILQVPWSPLIENTLEETQPMTDKQREQFFGQHDHVRLYGLDYPQRIAKAGFSVELYDVKRINTDENYLHCIAINRDEVVFLATKQS